LGADEVEEWALSQADRPLAVVDPSFGGKPEVVEHADQVTDCFVVVMVRSGGRGIDKSLPPGPSSAFRFGCEVTLSAQVRGQDFGEEAVVAWRGRVHTLAGTEHQWWPSRTAAGRFDLFHLPAFHEVFEVKAHGIRVHLKQVGDRDDAQR
jgi:hypothetical protein